MAVRSAELFTLLKTGSAAPDGPAVRYTVPAGRTVILKQLVLSSFSAAAPAIIVYYSSATVTQAIAIELAFPAAGVQIIDLWMVLEPGYRLQTFVDLVNAADVVWISAHGAILDGVA